jgi:CzcA family heavy metal efflux pump
MLALALIVIGNFSLEQLKISLLPHIIYPEIRVRVVDQGVPASVMEDRVTRQLEEQLAITEDAINVESSSSLGRSAVNLSFPYGKDIDIALRDASTRLDRAKRFLPESIDPPIIYKLDPSQIPVAEFVVSSTSQDPVSLRSWVDYSFSKWFVNLPGVAAVEVGGGLVREIQVYPDLQRLAAYGLSVEQLVAALRAGNVDVPVGRLNMSQQEIPGRASGRFTDVAQIRDLPLHTASGSVVTVGDVARVVDSHEEEQLRVRYNNVAGVKISIQKQPSANTVAVVEAVRARMAWLQQQNQIPADVQLFQVSDQSVYVKHALGNASLAAISGAILAMLVVYLFLGNLKRTLIIGSAIPMAVMVTFLFMNMGQLTLNVMSLGGLALGIGMLVDNTIVMLENIYRHQVEGERGEEAGTHAAREIYGAVVASTSTNLAAVLPFLFIGGLTGLLFRELIFTISAAIFASLLVAITLVPTLAVRVTEISHSPVRQRIDGWMGRLQQWYQAQLTRVLERRQLRLGVVAAFGLALILATPFFFLGKQQFLPKMDEGEVRVSIHADTGTNLVEMDHITRRVEQLLQQQPEVAGVFTIAGGRIFGRTESVISNYSTLTVYLQPGDERGISTEAWVQKMNTIIKQQEFAGVRVRLHTRGIRGIRTSRGEDDVSIRIQGEDLGMLAQLADQVVDRLKTLPGLRNVEHSAEEVKQELDIQIDRERAVRLGLSTQAIGDAIRLALEGQVATDFLDGDRSYDVRVRIDQRQISDVAQLEKLLLFPAGMRPVYLHEVASVTLKAAPAQIKRDSQQRIVEVSASLKPEMSLDQLADVIEQLPRDIALPEGYRIYDGGSLESLNQGKEVLLELLMLALLLVFVVMVLQYESLLNPLIIMISVPFAAIGVGLTLFILGFPVSMPVWLGLIMLVGIVVNNAIVLVEYIEQLRERGRDISEAVVEAARLRLRPILMTTLTTVVGMLPLALALGEGAEMLRPLAVTMVGGLSFSLLVSLLLIPVVYWYLHQQEQFSWGVLLKHKLRNK